MVKRVNTYERLSNLIALTAPLQSRLIVLTDIESDGYSIGSCEMTNQETGDAAKLATCFFIRNGLLECAFSFGGSPDEFTAFAHGITGAPKHKLYKAAHLTGPLPAWVEREENISRYKWELARQQLSAIPTHVPARLSEYLTKRHHEKL